MSRVLIAGTGMHPFGKFPNKNVKQLSFTAVQEAVKEAGIIFKDIEAAYVGNAFAGLTTGQESVRGQVILRSMGIDCIPIVNVENACASGSTAFHQAWISIVAGMYDMVLVLGVEKLFVGDTQKSIRALSSASDVEVMGSRGMQFTALYAMKAKDYMKKHGVTIEDFARVSVKNSKNGSLNPNAQFQKPLTLEKVLESRVISDPLTLFMCSPIADGAAAVILVSEKKAKQLAINKPIYIRGSWLASGMYQGKENRGSINSIAQLGRKVYEQAGIGPEEIDIVEVHDASASSEVEHIESLGFVTEGSGCFYLKSGDFDLQGKLPVNSSGGLLSRGHPVGATGIAQIYEIVKQLKQESGKRNISNGKKLNAGLCLNTGGRVDDDRAAMVATILSL